MSVFAISDLHLEYDENRRWLSNLSESDYRRDTLILAGDVADEERLLLLGFCSVARRFRHVAYVPGNHELWLTHDYGLATSFDKFERVCVLAADHGLSMVPFAEGAVTIVPLLGWYDYTFGAPSDDLLARWMDFRKCKWPADTSPLDITNRFLALNQVAPVPGSGVVISFSHFLPRIDLLPAEFRARQTLLHPVLGTTRLDEQVRQSGAAIHVYGHIHLNHDVVLDGTQYVNNAFGYPDEGDIATKALRRITGD